MTGPSDTSAPTDRGTGAPAATPASSPAISAPSPAAGDAGFAAFPPDIDLTLPAGEELVVTTDDGARLAVTLLGDAASTRPPVVLPHCWTGSRAIGVPVARRLVAAGHRVVLYDQRGHGDSTTGGDAITIARLGTDLAAVLEHLDLRNAVLAGHSMGGMTVMAFACAHAEAVRARVRGLALIATAAHGLSTPGRERFWRIVLAGDRLNRAMAHPRLGRAFVRPTFGRRARREHVEATRALFVDTQRDVRYACTEAMGDMDLRAVLRAVDLPAVVLLGRRDRLIVNKLTRAIAHHLDGADLVELPGAGHMLPLERADEVAAAIRRLAG